jgi:hypothetical protein
MPKIVVYELFTVNAASPEAAVTKVKEESSRKKSVVVAAESLDMLAHPVHLADAQAAFGKDNG